MGAAQPVGSGVLCFNGVVSAVHTHASVPIYVRDSQFDKNTLQAQLGLPPDALDTVLGRKFAAYVGDVFRGVHEELGTAVFSPSCTNHCGGMDTATEVQTLTIKDSDPDSQSLTPRELLSDWFFDRGDLTDKYKLVEPRYADGQPGNPTC